MELEEKGIMDVCLAARVLLISDMTDDYGCHFNPHVRLWSR